MVAAGSDPVIMVTSGSGTNSGVWYADSGATHHVTSDIANLHQQTGSCGLE